MPGRIFTSGSGYRYSINGQEKTPEIAPNATTALYWEYDSRIARRWNVDSKPDVSLSPYVAFSSNPILYRDVLGDTIILGENLLKNKFWMNSYEKFSASKEGKQFLEDYANSGKYGEVLVKFDIAELYWYHAETDPISVPSNNSGDYKHIRASGDGSETSISKLRKGDRLQLNVTLNWDRVNEKNSKEYPSNYGFLWEVFHGLTILHETQHIRLFTKELIEDKAREAVSTENKQHEVMKDPGGKYFQDRYNYLYYYLTPLGNISQLISAPLKLNPKIMKNISQMANAFDN